MGITMSFTVLVFSVIYATVVLALGPYSGYKVVRIFPTNEEETALLQAFLSDRTDIEIWKGPLYARSDVDILLSPLEYDDVMSVLDINGFDTRVFIEDVQKILDSQRRRNLKKSELLFDYSRYHDIEEIYMWIRNVSQTYKDIVSEFNITHTYEGRPLMGIKISTPSAKEKPAFWIEGGIHANEWIAPATVLYIAGQMLDRYQKDPELTSIVDMFDWYILPSTNPDGYAYTWIGDETRMWRKTRSQRGMCFGADPNRNWGVGWCESMTSNETCDRFYCGSSPFSEIEIEGVANYLSTIKGLKAFIDFHSYGQMWMSSWAYTRNNPDDFEIEDEGSKLAIEALEKVHGTQYKHGSIATTLYVAGGTSVDYVYGVLGVQYSYLVELRDTYEYGFLLPDDQIIPTGEETLAGLIALAKYIYNN